MFQINKSVWDKIVVLKLYIHMKIVPCLFQKATKWCEIKQIVYWSKEMMQDQSVSEIWLQAILTHKHIWREIRTEENRNTFELNPR